MNMLQIALREMIRRRGVLVNLLLVLCVISIVATSCPVMSQHATHYVAKYQRRVQANGAEVILTGFHVISGGHRPGEPQRRRSFLDEPLARAR